MPPLSRRAQDELVLALLGPDRMGRIANHLWRLTLGNPLFLREILMSPLTRREEEIGAMAAGAVTSREISERLHLSTRAVDNHLAGVYRKLGVAGREELSEVFR